MCSSQLARSSRPMWNGRWRRRRRGWPRSSEYVVGPPQYCTRNSRRRWRAPVRSGASGYSRSEHRDRWPRRRRRRRRGGGRTARRRPARTASRPACPRRSRYRPVHGQLPTRRPPAGALGVHRRAHRPSPTSVLAALAERTAALGRAAGMQIGADQGALLTLLTRLVGATAGRRGRHVHRATRRSASPAACSRAGTCCAATSARSTRRSPRTPGPRPASPTSSSCASARRSRRCAPCPTRRRSTSPSSTPTRAATPPTTTSCCPGSGPAGSLLADNTLWSGRVVDDDADDDNTVAIRAFNDLVAADDRVESYILPVGDGLTLIRKR